MLLHSIPFWTHGMSKGSESCNIHRIITWDSVLQYIEYISETADCKCPISFSKWWQFESYVNTKNRWGYLEYPQPAISCNGKNTIYCKIDTNDRIVHDWVIECFVHTYSRPNVRKCWWNVSHFHALQPYVDGNVWDQLTWNLDSAQLCWIPWWVPHCLAPMMSYIHKAHSILLWQH